MAREWIKITLSYLFLHILAPLHCRERNTRSSRIEAEPCTQVPRQKCALDAHSAPHGMTALPEVQRQQWVDSGRQATSLNMLLRWRTTFRLSEASSFRAPYVQSGLCRHATTYRAFATPPCWLTTSSRCSRSSTAWKANAFPCFVFSSNPRRSSSSRSTLAVW